MSQFDDSGYKAFTAGVAIPQWSRVIITSGKLAIAAITSTTDIGVTIQEAFADGDKVTVALATKPGTVKCIASAALTKGALCWTAADGEVSVSASTGRVFGVCMEAATADQDIIEVMRMQMVGAAV